MHTGFGYGSNKSRILNLSNLKLKYLKNDKFKPKIYARIARIQIRNFVKLTAASCFNVPVLSAPVIDSGSSRDSSQTEPLNCTLEFPKVAL